MANEAGQNANPSSQEQEYAPDGHKYSDEKGIWGWMLMDWAMQPFNTLLLTFTFAPYFASRVAPNPVEGQSMWAYAIGTGGIIIAILSPILGAVADNFGRRKPWIFVFAILGAIGAWMLWYMTPKADAQLLQFGLIAIIICMIGFEFIAVFINSMMPGLVPRERMGSLSGTSWGVGYVGGLLSLVFCLLFLATNPDTLKTFIGTNVAFGLDAAAGEGDRATGPFTAIWLLIFCIPFFLFTPDPANPNRPKGSPLSVIWQSLKKLGRTIKKLPETPSLFAFLVSSMSYRDALNGLYAFGGVYAAGVLGWDSIHLGAFGIIAALTGAIGAYFGGKMDDQLGTKTVVYGAASMLIVICIVVLSISKTEVFFMDVGSDSILPTIMFYICGCGIGACGASLQASSRVLMADQAEPGKMGEAFGLYALTGRATSFISPYLIGLATAMSGSQRVGVAPVILLFIVGLVLLRWVKEQDHEAA